MNKKTIGADLVCSICIEQGTHYEVSSGIRKNANELMELHIRKRHLSPSTNKEKKK